MLLLIAVVLIIASVPAIRHATTVIERANADDIPVGGLPLITGALLLIDIVVVNGGLFAAAWFILTILRG